MPEGNYKPEIHSESSIGEDKAAGFSSPVVFEVREMKYREKILYWILKILLKED